MPVSNFVTGETLAATARRALILAIVTAGIVIAVPLVGQTSANALDNAVLHSAASQFVSQDGLVMPPG